MNIRLRIVVLIGMGALAVSLMATLPAYGTLVLIGNAGFESPITSTYVYGTGSGVITDWVISGPTGGGVWTPATFGYGTPPPEGTQTGFINNGSSTTPTSVSQVLSVGLAPNTIYTLGIVVGSQANYNMGLNYDISLWAGSTLLTSVTPLPYPDNAWTPLSATYTTSASVASGNLKIVITAPKTSSSSGQLLFDDVSLNATAVPEPTTMIAGALLLLPFGASTLRVLRRRTT